MKKQLLLLLLASGLLTLPQCAKSPDPVPAPALAPKPDYDRESARIIQALRPVVAGDWVLRRVFIKAQAGHYGQAKLGIRRDTVFQDLATLTLQPPPAGSAVSDPRSPIVGSLRFRSKTYPVRLELLAAPERVVNNKGPQVFFLLQTNFPIGSRPTESEEQFLDYLGLLSENFSLEVTDEQPGMTWRGLNRGIEKIELQRL